MDSQCGVILVVIFTYSETPEEMVGHECSSLFLLPLLRNFVRYSLVKYKLRNFQTLTM